MREILYANKTFHVNPATGSDANDGTSASPWQHVQYGCDYITDKVDCAGYVATLQCADGNYSENVVLAHHLLGYSSFKLRGNLASPSSCNWVVSGGQTCIASTDGAMCIVGGFKFSASSSGSSRALTAIQGAILDWHDCEFGAMVGGCHISVGPRGQMNALNSQCGATYSYTISGGANAHLEVTKHATAVLCSQSAYIASGLTFNSFAYCQWNSYMDTQGIQYAGPGTGNNTSGLQYYCDPVSSITLNQTRFPGNGGTHSDHYSFAS